MRFWGRRTAVIPLLLASLITGADAASADYLQVGYNAARTGDSPDAGPALDEVAWNLTLPGSRALGPPLIIGDGVYVLTSDQRLGPDLTTSGVFRLDLATGGLEQIIELQPPPYIEGSPPLFYGLAFPPSFASDGERLYVATDEAIAGYPLDGGEPLWSWAQPRFHPGHLATYCPEPAVRDALLVVACTEYAHPPSAAGAPPTLALESTLYIVTLDTADGTGGVLWIKDPLDDALGENAPPAPICEPARPVLGCLTADRRILFAYSVSVVGPSAFVLAASVIDQGQPTNDVRVWAISLDDGSVAWERSALDETRSTIDDVAAGGEAGPVHFSAVATGTSSTLYLRFGDLRAVNAASGDEIWSQEIGKEDPRASEGGGGGLALVGEALYALSAQSVYAFRTSDQARSWTTPFTLDSAGGESWGSSSPLVAGGHIYVRATGPPPATAPTDVLPPDQPGLPNAIYALHARDGTLAWRHPFPAPLKGAIFRSVDFAVANGVLAAAGQDGSLVVIGRTSGSIVPRADVSDRYPSPGGTVEVDLSGSEPGLQGAPTAFWADWGDGTTSPWQPSAVLEHTYNATGDHLALFSVRNDAGQSATEPVTFHVGAAAPTPLERAFAAENQNAAFFLLGLLITAVGATIGITRAQRRRSLLAREMAAVNALVAETREDAPALDAALAERRAHARGLLVDGRLDQAQFGALEGHIDERGRASRLGQLDERFDFLPHGMVKTLREMLEDGKISKWEHAHFVQALDGERLLTAGQKAQVRKLIDGWFARDAGAAK